jgi:hypothetical protein
MSLVPLPDARQREKEEKLLKERLEKEREK